MQGGQLVGLEAGIAQVVGVLGHPVAEHVGVEGVEGLGDEGDAQLPQRLLVPLEGPAEGGVVLGVAREPEAELVDGERPLGFQQGGNQVDEPLEPVHGRPMLRARRGCIPAGRAGLSGTVWSVTTRSRLLLLLRKHPGITVTDLAAELGLTGMGVRRHLESLEIDGLVERSACCEHRVGRPPNGWRLTSKGLELLPRGLRHVRPPTAGGHGRAVGRRGPRRRPPPPEREDGRPVPAELADADTLDEQVAGLAQVRDRAGYLAEWHREGEVLVLIENNCAVHRVAERYPAVCAMELALFRKVLGPDVEVTRVSHTMAGDATCTYCVRPRPADPPSRLTLAA